MNTIVIVAMLWNVKLWNVIRVEINSKNKNEFTARYFDRNYTHGGSLFLQNYQKTSAFLLKLKRLF